MRARRSTPATSTWCWAGCRRRTRRNPGCFQKSVSVRKTGATGKELADRYFFETFVRVHRAGEGAAYTGLKTAGEIEPAIAAADKSIETGKLEPVAKLVKEQVEHGLHKQFEAVASKGSSTRTTWRQRAPTSVPTSSTCTMSRGCTTRPAARSPSMRVMHRRLRRRRLPPSQRGINTDAQASVAALPARRWWTNRQPGLGRCRHRITRPRRHAGPRMAAKRGARWASAIGVQEF